MFSNKVKSCLFGVKPGLAALIVLFLPAMVLAGQSDNTLRKKVLEGPDGKRAIRDVVEDSISAEGSRLEELNLVLAVRKQEALPEVIRKLDTGTVAEKRKMTKLLRRTRWPEAEAKLVEMATSDNENEISRIGALYAIGATGNSSGAARIAEKLDVPNRGAMEKKVIISTLARLKYKQAIPQIEKYADANDALVRIFAIRALAELGKKQDVQFLFETLKNEDYVIRQEACGALGSLDSPEAVSKLEDVSQNDVHRSVRRAAKMALNIIQLSRLSENQKITYLEGLATDGDRKVSNWAVQTLAMESGEKGRGKLKEMAAKSAPGKRDIAVELLMTENSNGDALTEVER